VSGPSEWWAEQLESVLSQGDIVARVPIARPVSPQKYLEKWPLAKGTPGGWKESLDPVRKGSDDLYFLSAGRVVHGLMLSHSCELDKGGASNKRVVVAPVLPIDDIAESQRENLLAQKYFNLMPLPEIPGIGTCYANLRLITSIHRDVIGNETRVASMTPAALKRLMAQLAAFFMRLEPPEGWKELGEG
jgi:hypothetical protein